jgi:hypothetical protein
MYFGALLRDEWIVDRQWVYPCCDSWTPTLYSVVGQFESRCPVTSLGFFFFVVFFGGCVLAPQVVLVIIEAASWLMSKIPLFINDSQVR